MESLNVIKSQMLMLLLAAAFIACTSGKNKEGADASLESIDEETTELTTDMDSVVEEQVATTIDWTSSDEIIMDCGGAVNLADPIGEIAANLTEDSLMYDVKPFSDCSGTFHRVLDSLNKRCSNYEYPSKESYRDSRALGRWYFEQGDFIRITDALNQGHLIKPGAVMFYGPRMGNIDSLGVEALFARGGINHVGVIVSVTKDDDGVVTGYSLFHGQRPGKYASTTNYHKRAYRNRPEYPPYGNGSEQWVGIAPIITESADAESASAPTSGDE